MPTRRALIIATAAVPLLLHIAAKDAAASKVNPSRMRIRCIFDGQSFTATLFDTAAARELIAMLPLDLQIEDYYNNEKIAYLPHKLTEGDSEPFSGEAAGDVCYYAP